MPDAPASIQLLSDHVINKIAAGEVVERPASVVKEVLENAIDAGADRIEVVVVGGGKRLIRVTDNGRGMTREDALLSIERHATSKIRDVDDIEQIETLGFRGEALAAIASVSRFRLASRPADRDAGTEVTVTGGRVQSVEDTGCAPGTLVEVRSLFFNVPARRKFLRTEQTEFAHVRQMFLIQALAHPGLGLRLVADERPIYELPGGASLEERIRDLFSAELVRALVPIAYRDVEARITGFAGLPSSHRGDRSEQYIFVNGRPAAAPVIGHAVRESYQSLIPKGRHPVLFLFLETDPGQVDVNVHPTKKDVRFRRSREIRDAVLHAIREALEQEVPADPSGAPAGPAPSRAAPFHPSVSIPDLPKLEPFAYPRREADPPEGGGGTADDGDAKESDARPDEAPWAWCRILGQVGGFYVVLETDEGLVLMDPQAAHERVMFERLMRGALASGAASQGLLAPESVELTPAEALCVRDNETLLRKMGFGISEFGGDSFLVDAMPVCLGNASPGSILGQVARGLETGGERGGTERHVEEQVARAASAAAVSSVRALPLKEMERLVTDLGRADMPYTSPRGRPTIIFMGFRELDTKFGRTR